MTVSYLDGRFHFLRKAQKYRIIIGIKNSLNMNTKAQICKPKGYGTTVESRRCD
jgi:hypothetical protein